ncbi:MAG: SDR family NAD(P)-dependent oxidoreductase, partial [Actinomycetota bacterium]
MTGNVDIAGVAAIVTGGGGGLGAAICARLARDGWTVVVNDIDAAAVERVVASIAAFGGACITDSFLPLAQSAVQAPGDPDRIVAYPDSLVRQPNG